jgi:hypothetical protein
LICALLALGLGALCIWIAARRWWGLAQAASRLGRRWQRDSGPSSQQRLAMLAGSLLGEERGQRVVASLLGAPSRAYAVAELNELLAEAAQLLEADASGARAAARAALTGGMLFALVELARTLPSGQLSIVWALAALASGLVAALVAAALGRLAGSNARELRDAWNTFSRAATRHMPAEDSVADSALLGPCSAVEKGGELDPAPSRR